MSNCYYKFKDEEFGDVGTFSFQLKIALAIITRMQRNLKNLQTMCVFMLMDPNIPKKFLYPSISIFLIIQLIVIWKVFSVTVIGRHHQNNYHKYYLALVLHIVHTNSDAY